MSPNFEARHELAHSYFLILTSAKIVLINPINILYFLAFALLFFIILIAVPATTIPGNDFFFQLSILRPIDHLLLLTLSILTALSASFHVYIFKNKKSKDQSLKHAGQTGISFISGLVGTVFGTASCSVCVASIFGFLGFGAVLFLLKFRLYIVSAAIILTLISLHYLAKKVLGYCKECQLKR